MTASSTAVSRQRTKNRRKPSATRRVPRLLTAWQRALVWASWLLWVWMMWRNSANVSMGGAEWLSLLAAVAVTVICKRRPLGPAAVFIEKPEEMRGEFESRTNWALVLIGAAILLGGVASAVR